MRAAIRQTQQRRVVGQHRVDDVVIVLIISDDREEQEFVRPGREVIVRHFVRRMIGTARDGVDAFVRAWLVIWWIAHRKDTIPALGDVLPKLRQAVEQFG